MVLTYTNDRRGGENDRHRGGGLLGRREPHRRGAGEHRRVNQPRVQTVPYHPVLPSHIDAVHALANTRLPQVLVNDTHLQARSARMRRMATASVVVANRWTYDINAKLATRVAGRQVNLPRSGTFVLPASTGLVLPVNYPLERSRTLVQATAQLLTTALTATSLVLELLAPGGGEVVVELEAAPSAVTAWSGSPPSFAVPRQRQRLSATISVALPAGTDTVTTHDPLTRHFALDRGDGRGKDRRAWPPNLMPS